MYKLISIHSFVSKWCNWWFIPLSLVFKTLKVLCLLLPGSLYYSIYVFPKNSQECIPIFNGRRKSRFSIENWKSWLNNLHLQDIIYRLESPCKFKKKKISNLSFYFTLSNHNLQLVRYETLILSIKNMIEINTIDIKTS